jgi:hypothetical protein
VLIWVPPGAGAGAGVGAGVGREAEVAVPKLVCATPYKALRKLINRLRRDLNSDSTTYTITKIKP